METLSDKPKKSNRIKSVVATVGFLIIVYAGLQVYNFLYKPNVPGNLKKEIILIPTGSGLDDVIFLLKKDGFIEDETTFRLMAEKMKYRGRPGRFKIKPNWTNRRLVQHLRGGKQEPVKLVLVNERLPEQVAGKVARFIEPDSLAIIDLLNNERYLDSIGYTPQLIMTLFIPNTYEFFWNTSPRKFMERMIKENKKFWTKNNRLEKAKKWKMTKEEVYILASIVERETNQNKEKKRMAGVYMNRLERGMLLQADPTLVFASRDWESRSLAKYKTLDSPYNTYMYKGLPPGPISMASIPSIDAVLNREKHNYIYFCAAGNESGLHNFAETYNGHLKNIQIYKRNLRKRGLL
ncbi:MAG TPA: endolytic transglycosylase MltG [Bacteroidetes bacterium]|nr:endolytic transglycosylase MltG [Bacteroidota bacterium]